MFNPALPDWPLPHPEHPLYRSIAALCDYRTLPHWPAQPDYDALLAAARARDPHIPARLHFALDLEPELYYEQHIAAHGEVPTRSRSWHDWFNALAWLAWPRSKQALNARHQRAIARGEVQRGPLRDAATLLDECGIVIACSDPALAYALRAMDWTTLFIDRRAAWGNAIDALVLGHALFEQGLNMHLGWCGKAWLIEVDPAFFSLDADSRRQALDATLASQLGDDTLLARPRELLPLPLLGIPGWWDANRDPAFYCNRDYFRTSRRANSATVTLSS